MYAKLLQGAGGFRVHRWFGKTTTINSQSFVVTGRDATGVTRCSGAAVPTDAGSGFAIGCEFILTTANGIGTTRYMNEGSASSCDFNPVATPEVGDISSVTAGNGLTGGGASGAVSLAVGAGRGIVVRSGAVDVGVNVYNATGGLLAAGTLVYLSGYNTTLGITIAKADADAGLIATHVVVDAIGITNAGVVYPVATLTGQNTGGRTIGDPVYLDNTTAGGFVFSAPTGADQAVQIVGYVKVVHASTGEIEFFPGLRMVTKLPTSLIQDLAVSTAKIAAASITAAKIAETQNATATADGTGSGSITTLTGFKKFVSVTSANAADQVSLPGINVGTIGQEIILMVGANGFELITPAASNVTINQVDSDGTNQLDVAANTAVRCTQISGTAWLAEQIAATGITVVAPDND